MVDPVTDGASDMLVGTRSIRRGTSPRPAPTSNEGRGAAYALHTVTKRAT
jgi:hypothetical protein